MDVGLREFVSWAPKVKPWGLHFQETEVRYCGHAWKNGKEELHLKFAKATSFGSKLKAPRLTACDAMKSGSPYFKCQEPSQSATCPRMRLDGGRAGWPHGRQDTKFPMQLVGMRKHGRLAEVCSTGWRPLEWDLSFPLTFEGPPRLAGFLVRVSRLRRLGPDFSCAV